MLMLPAGIVFLITGLMLYLVKDLCMNPVIDYEQEDYLNCQKDFVLANKVFSRNMIFWGLDCLVLGIFIRLMDYQMLIMIVLEVLFLIGGTIMLIYFSERHLQKITKAQNFVGRE